MSEEKEITTRDIRLLMFGLDPITRKNLLSFTKNKSPKEAYGFINNFKRVKGLDTKKGIGKYIDKRSGGCKGCRDNNN